ncbi:MAG: hypothetical protein IT441_06990 [Phycisphaeraceae bacterium]|nr:hypothetical protein [Phycisphaeraceae bacterium]
MSPSSIAPASFWAHFFLENPWPIAAVAALIAGTLMWLNRQVGRRSLAWTALGVVLIGCLGTPLLAVLVHTSREQLIDRTRQLVRAAGPVNPGTLRSIFDPQAVLLGPDGDAWLTVPQMLRVIDTLDQRYTIARHKLDILAAGTTGPDVGLCQIDLVSHFTRGPAPGRPMRTRWQLTWRRDPSGSEGQPTPWRLTRVQWLKHPAADAVQPQMGVWDLSF